MTTPPAPNTPPAPTSPTRRPAGAASPAAGGVARLRNGELRRQVAGFLAGRPGDEFTPGEVARHLSAASGTAKSSGAVANALATLTGLGQAEQTSTRPARYRATAATAAAALPAPTAPTTPAPSPSAVPAAAPAPAGQAARPGRTRRASARRRSAPAATPAAAGAAPAAAPVGDRPGVATGAVPVTGPVARPNGTMYHPRRVDGAGLPDVTALRRLREAGVPALLYGPPGTGKTSVVEATFPDLITVAGDADTTVADLVGEYTQPEPGRYVFVPGPLPTAMAEGRPLFVDDATLISPTVLAVLYPAMDGRREITIKANGGQRVTAAPGFYVIAGHNPGVHGAVLSDALSSRFAAQIRVSTDYDLAEALGIDRRAVRVARNLAARQTAGEVGWAPQLRELIAFARIADVLGDRAAAGNLIGQAPEEDRDTVASVVTNTFGAAVTPLSLGPRI